VRALDLELEEIVGGKVCTPRITSPSKPVESYKDRAQQKIDLCLQLHSLHPQNHPSTSKISKLYSIITHSNHKKKLLKLNPKKSKNAPL